MFQKPTYEELFEENQMLKAIIKSLSENQERQETRIAELEAILKQKGSGLQLPHEPDKIVEHLPKQCERCEHKDV